MRYLVTASNRGVHHTFKVGTVYDERYILNRIGEKGLKLVRPNGSTRYRGSRRLLAKAKDGTTMATFQAEILEDKVVLPVPVGFI